MSETLNRAFMYGESVFTTVRMINGRLIDWDQHFERLKKGVEFVYGPFTDAQDWIAIFKNLVELKCQSESGDKILRFTVYREQARGQLKCGLLSVTDLKIHLSSSVYDRSLQVSCMTKLRTCPADLRSHWWPSYLKAGSYLNTILAQKVYLKPGDDDVLFLSGESALETSIANLFVVRQGSLYTAPPGPNVLDGIMRRKVLNVGKEYFPEVIESAPKVGQLYKADAIFCTNSVRGPFLVDRVDEHELTYKKDFLDLFEKLKARVFE